MESRKKTNRKILIIGGGLTLFSVFFKVFKSSFNSQSEVWERCFNALRYLCQITLFVLWGISIRSRIIRKQVRAWLLGVVGMELFWLLLRTVKYEFAINVTMEKYLWYLYYLPMLLIPVLCLCVADSLGKPDDYKGKKALSLLFVVSAVLFLPVITNDLHSLVFRIPPYPSGIEVGNYSYGPFFFIISAYALVCSLGCMVVFWMKCRIPGKKGIRVLPLIPLIVMVLGCALNGIGIVVYFGYHLDISMFICLCVSFTLELSIQCGLILANTGYEELFEYSSIRARIVNNEDEPLLVSAAYEQDVADAVHYYGKSQIITEKGIRVSSFLINQGYAIWQEDISELNGLVEQLALVNDYLEDRNLMIQKDYEYQRRERQLEEKNRLYNRMLTHTQKEIETYLELAKVLEYEENPERIRYLTVRIAFVSAFIKRRDNLIFLNEAENRIHSQELVYCVEELLAVLRLCGVDCYVSQGVEGSFSFDEITECYEIFYRVIWKLFDVITSVCVYLLDESQRLKFLLRIAATEDLQGLLGESVQIIKEEDEWLVTIIPSEGGGDYEV